MTVRVGELQTSVEAESSPVPSGRPKRPLTKDQRLREHRAMTERLARDARRTHAKGYDG